MIVEAAELQKLKAWCQCLFIEYGWAVVCPLLLSFNIFLQLVDF